MTINLNKGQHAQLTQAAELTGSIISSNLPVGLMSAHNCMNVPAGVSYCDHGEQMIPPVHALGNSYANVMYRPRTANETSTFWKIVGAVDGTTLTYSSAVSGPATVNKGDAVTFQTGTPFVVTSQDADHPFEMFQYMTSSTFSGEGYGDPDFVDSVPPEQYLSDYVFFADPTYPETNLVLTRERDGGQFADVTIDCVGVVGGWQPIDSADTIEYTRVDLVTGNFAAVGTCNNGLHTASSPNKFGLTVWGWGSAATGLFSTQAVSYAYPAGQSIKKINNVVIE